MLYEVLKHIRNFFPDVEGQKEGEFTISNGVIAPSVDLSTGQYYLIEGSTFNDGIHRQGNALENEGVFKGTVTPLKIPHDLLALAEEIASYSENNKPSAYVSESFGGYSYTRATKNGIPMSWQDAFRTRLNAWRKV